MCAIAVVVLVQKLLPPHPAVDVPLALALVVARRRHRRNLKPLGDTSMTTHTTASREQWLAARLELLEAEKELTRRSDEVARQRQELPWVPVEKEYRFETEAGVASLADLFGGRSQLLVYHFMFGPEYTGGCPSCSAIADGFNGFAVTPRATTTSGYRRVARPDRRAARVQATHGLDVPLGLLARQRIQLRLQHLVHRGPAALGERSTTTTAAGHDVAARRRRQGGAAAHAAMTGTDTATYMPEQPGMSAFALEDGPSYHTYSAYARGLDGLWGMYQWLDRAPQGRNETGPWWRRHDEYQ